MEENKTIKQSVRIQTSLLSVPEKKFLVWMAGRLPKWVTSDSLTLFGVIGAFVAGLGYFLANYNLNWLWLSSLGFVMNWFGDSLDGSLARVRNQQRKLYGYYLDHNIDCICEFFIFVGIGMSGLLNFWLALLCYVVYLQLEVYVAINAKIKNEFKLTYFSLGPTEFRVVMILVNCLLMYVIPLVNVHHIYPITIGMNTYQLELQLMDYIGFIIWLILFICYIVSFFQDLHYFAKMDPLIKHDEKK